MQELACEDLNEEPCDFVATGDTSEVTVNEMFVHMESSHSWKVGGLTFEEHKQLVEPWNKYITVR
jgi:predicted small metal-binding protein